MTEHKIAKKNRVTPINSETSIVKEACRSHSVLQDTALWIAALWIILSVAIWSDSLPSGMGYERVFFLLADTQFFFAGMGISFLLFMASKLFQIRIKNGVWIMIRNFSISLGIAIFVLVVINTYLGQQWRWSEEYGLIAKDVSDSTTVFLPLIPISERLLSQLTPQEAINRQLLLLGILYEWYVFQYACCFSVFQHSDIAFISCMLLHFAGYYVLSAWPPWICAIPQSYCFIQNYEPWALLPTQYHESSLLRMMFFFLIPLVLTIIVHIIRKKVGGNDNES